MSEPHAFELDPYRTELATEVREVGADGARPFAVLSDTILYPEGGGQPADRGWLGETAITDVQRVGGTIRHYLAAPADLGPATLRLDWSRRFDHMQQHTGQHLLSAVAEDRLSWATTAFHLGEAVSDVELAAPRLAAEAVSRLEEVVAAEIRAARPVLARRVAPAELARLQVRTRGLPDGHVGEVRLVEIEGIDLNTCGGTHVRSTAEIECLKLLGCEPMRGGTRLYFVAGGRVRRRLADHEARNASLRAQLGVPDGEIPEAVGARLEEIRRLTRRARDLEEELADATATTLARSSEPVATAHFEARDLAFLQRLGRGVAGQAPAKAAFLTASSQAGACFVLAAGAAVSCDLAALGREIATLLEGRGGGAGNLFQGKAGSLARREQALALLQAALAK